MIIDFHIHAFPNDIAERAINTLSEVVNVQCHTNGTMDDTRRLLEEQRIDYGVLLPIATKPTQQFTINSWAAEQFNGRIISFGTVHPDAPDVEEEIYRIKSLGLKGIKIHPDYQNVFLFEEKMKPIYRLCEELKLPLLMHMGYDPLSPAVRHAMPYHLLTITEEFPKLKIIGAHLGGVFAWEEVLFYLCGRDNIWLDTAHLAGWIEPKLLTAIIKKHGADKILFASDCPWHKPQMELELIETLPLTEAEKERIYWKNATELLEIN